MKKLFLIIALVFLLPQWARATTYYVDRAGVDSGFSNEALNCSTPSDTDYNPTTRQCGSGSDTVYNGINNIDSVLQAGDVGYVRHGTWSNSSLDYMDNVVYSGIQTSKITLMAYPGETPDFNGLDGFSLWANFDQDWWVVDGLHFTNVDSTGARFIDVNGNHNEFKNLVISQPAGTSYKSTFFQLNNFTTTSDCQTATFNSFHDITATGNGNPGTGAQAGMGQGDFIYIKSACFTDVYNNTLARWGHAVIDVERAGNSPPPTCWDGTRGYCRAKYNKIRDNVVDQSEGGGGFYLNMKSDYNLVSGNLIKNIGGNTSITQNKGGILARSEHNTVRLNKIVDYGHSGTEAHRGIMMGIDTSGGNDYGHHQLIYNNVIHGGYGIPLYVRERSAGFAFGDCDSWSVKNTIVVNNAIYLAPQARIVGSGYTGTYTPDAWYGIWMGLYLDSSCSPWSPYANENEFFNNYIYTGNHPGQNDNYVGYYYGSGGHANEILTEESTYEDFQNPSDTTTWINSSDPGFNDPGSPNYDYTLQNDSVLIDAGVGLSNCQNLSTGHDAGSDCSYKAEVEAACNNLPSAGWTNQTTDCATFAADWDPPSYNGSAPDIGAEEYTAAAPTVSSATTDGETVTVVFSESVTSGVGGTEGWTITPSGGAATMAYSSGSGTNTWVYDLSRTILQGETAVLAYTQPGDGIKDLDGNLLDDITGQSVTNNSTQVATTVGGLGVGLQRY